MFNEAIWRNKTDDEVAAAALRLSDYTEEAQRVIGAEMQRRELTAAQPIESDLDEDEPLEASSFVRRLWKGQLPLRTTYWVWGVGGALIWAVVLALAPNAITVVLLSLLQLGYVVVILVAIWRSAERYRGRPVWAAMARISVTVTIVRLVVGVMAGMFGA